MTACILCSEFLDYGARSALLRLEARACHRRGLALVVDVVYNHLGPEGNYLRNSLALFYRPVSYAVGEAINFDGPNSHPCGATFLRMRCIGFGTARSGCPPAGIRQCTPSSDHRPYLFIEDETCAQLCTRTAAGQFISFPSD